MKGHTIILALLFMVNGAFSQWGQQNSGTEESLCSVHFTNANSGHIVGDSGTILGTTNGGNDWVIQVSGTTAGLRSVFFPDPETGYAVGDAGTILKTTDGGSNWIFLFSGTTHPLYSVYFSDALTGFIVGDSGKILKTTNGGMTWINQIQVVNLCLHSIHFPCTDIGFIVGDSGTILKSNDEGVTWMQQNSGTTINLLSVHFPDVDTGYAAGSQWLYSPIIGYYLAQITIKTTDGGANWVDGMIGTGGRSIWFTDANNGYGAGFTSYIGATFGIIRHTGNGGIDWLDEEYIHGVGFNSIHFPCTDTGYAVGHGDAGGVIYKTTNGGHPVGINRQGTRILSLNLTPNPASTTITIETKSKGSLSILNLNGQPLLQTEITERTNTVDVSTLPNGVYVAKVVREKGVQVGRFIKQ